MPRCYIGNLPYTATESDIRDFFNPFQLTSVKVIYDRETQRPRGFAFIDLPDNTDLRSFIEKFDQLDFGGRTIVVSEAKEKPQQQQQQRRDNRR